MHAAVVTGSRRNASDGVAWEFVHVADDSTWPMSRRWPTRRQGRCTTGRSTGGGSG